MIRASPDPAARAASTYSFSRRERKEREDYGDAVWAAVPEKRGQRKQHREAGEREHKVRQAHQQVVGPASVVPGERTDEHADQRGQACDKECDALGGLDAVDDPAEVVAPEHVCPEVVLVLQRRTDAGVLQVNLVVGVRSDPVGRGAGAEDDEQNDEADHREAVTDEPPPRIRPLATRLHLEAGRVGELERIRQRRFVRLRGRGPKLRLERRVVLQVTQAVLQVTHTGCADPGSRR